MNSLVKIIASFIIIILGIQHNSPGQRHDAPCEFDHIIHSYDLPAIEKRIQKGINQIYTKTNHDSIKTIPIVVHIIHEGGTENISEAQVQSGIDVLNEDYGKTPSTPGFGNGVDTRLRFKLARIAPNGNCTNGIVRVESELTNHESYQRPLLKELSFWNNKKYLNIYVVKSISGGTLGYSSFPGGPDNEDGIVIEHDAFGRIEAASSSMGRTLTHEVGHWLGLYHTFQDGCGTDTCSTGDLVCDTPPVAEANFGCTVTNSCSNDSPDLNDQIENYMDYTDDNCKNMFTNGQKERMHGSLNSIRTEIWSDSNLVATGCDSNYTPPGICSVSAQIITLTSSICVGNSIQFHDISLNDATSWEWSFEGGSPATSTDENPIIQYNNTGTFDVTLKVTNSNSADSAVFTNYIEVTNPGIGDPLPIQETFDEGVFPDSVLTLINRDGGITWEIDSNASVSGDFSLSINNLINTNYGSVDEILLPYIDFTSIDTSYYLSFQYAYAKSVSIYSDELIVDISTDCGSTYQTLLKKSGTSFATGPTQTTPFIPDSSEWREVYLDLSLYKNEKYARIRFSNITDGGNKLYIDDINLSDITMGIKPKPLHSSSKELFRVYPNPADSRLSIQLNEVLNKANLSITNSLGEKVYEDQVQQKHYTINNLQKLDSGIYFIKIEQGAHIEVKKLVIQH